MIPKTDNEKRTIKARKQAWKAKNRKRALFTVYNLTDLKRLAELSDFANAN